MIRNLLEKSISRYVLLALLLLFLIFTYQFFDINLIYDLFTDGQDSLNDKGIYILILIFLLRSISIFIPVIPGTYCVVIAGYIYGIERGVLIMFFADFFSCYTSFLISRRLGRGFVKKLLGPNQMAKIENISKKYLEQNIFLMTGFLMTSWFDFVCYAVGLTKISWRKFMPALVVSILISDLPFVAGGYTLSQLKDVTFSQVLNGEVGVIQGPYLFILIISALIIFGIGLLNIFIKKRTKCN